MTVPGLLATLNLFRNEDGSVSITVAEWRGAIQEMNRLQIPANTPPVVYIRTLVKQAACGMNVND